MTATIPVPTEYKHIHFGVWAGLGDAAKDGSQTIADLGIGFVQNYDGSGETDNMPLQGDATTTATGSLRYRRRTRTVMATSRCVTVPRRSWQTSRTTKSLSTLRIWPCSRAISLAGSTFSDEDATATDISDTHGLDASGTFEGSFSGAFYGSKAAEVGGVFDFSSDDMEEGAFRGAFGGDKK